MLPPEMIRGALQGAGLIQWGLLVFCYRCNNTPQAGRLDCVSVFSPVLRPGFQDPGQSCVPSEAQRGPPPLLVLMSPGPPSRVLNISLLYPPSPLPPSYTDSQEGTKAPRQPRVGPTPNSIPSAEVLSLVKVTFTVSGISRERTSLGATFQLTKGGHGQSHRNKQSRIPQCSPFVKVKASSAREVGVREADGVGRTTHRFVFGAEGRGSQLTAVVGL